MKQTMKILLLIYLLANCSNSNDVDSRQTILIALNDFVEKSESSNIHLDARKIVTRQKINQSGLAVLFVELENGHNGTLVRYPGLNEGSVWLGTDGATVTLEKGFLIATRGMGDDLMSTVAKFPNLDASSDKPISYQRTYHWLNEDNKIRETSYECVISLKELGKRITVFEKEFTTDVYDETCDANSSQISNVYYLDRQNIIRRSYQHHSGTLGQILIERLDAK